MLTSTHRVGIKLTISDILPRNAKRSDQLLISQLTNEEMAITFQGLRATYSKSLMLGQGIHAHLNLSHL